MRNARLWVQNDELLLRVPEEYRAMIADVRRPDRLIADGGFLVASYPRSVSVANALAQYWGAACSLNLDIAPEVQAALYHEFRSVKPEIASKTPLWPHQVDGYQWLEEHPNAMLAWWMGRGKSLLIVLQVVNHDIPLTLIHCPKSVAAVWRWQFTEHAAKACNVMVLGEGSVKRRIETLQALMRDKRRPPRSVVVINYEAARTPAMSKALSAIHWPLIVCDESHYIKSPGAKQAWAAARLKAERRVCLTGTPMSHSPLDVYAQFRFLDRRVFGTSFVAFRHRYAVMGGFENRQVVAYRNLDDLHERFYRLAHRVGKDVDGLPPLVHQQYPVTLGARARKHYAELWRDFVTFVCHSTGTGEVSVSNALAKLLRCQQITSGFLPADSEDTERLVEIDTAKADALRDILTGISLDVPVVVFCRFRHDLNVVHRIAGELEQPRLVDELSGRQDDVKGRWSDGSSATVAAVQIRSGGVGIDLTRATYAVFYSASFSYGEFEQAISRLHRPGQTASVTCIHLIATDTVDEKIYATLANKRNVIEDVLTYGDRHGEKPE